MSEINTTATATPATVEPAFDLTLKYNLDEEGRIKSLQTGGDGKQSQSVKGQITLSQFLRDFKPFGFKLGEDGRPEKPDGSTLYDFTIETAKLAYHKNAEELARPTSNPEKPYWYDRTYSAPQTFDSLLKDWLDTRQQQQQIIVQALEIRKANNERKAQEEAEKVVKRQVEINALVNEFFTDPSARISFIASDYVSTLRGGWAVKEGHPRYAEYRAEAIRRNEADDAAKKVEDETRVKAKASQIAAWVAEFGDENQRERWGAGLLPEAEAVDAIEALAFDPIGAFETYERIKRNDVRAKCDGNCACASDYRSCEVEFESKDSTKATAEQWEKMKAIRSLLPAAIVTLREHSGVCQDDDCKTGSLTRYSLLVKLTVGAFTFTRSLAA